MNRRIGQGLLALGWCLLLLAGWRCFVEARFLASASVHQGRVVSVSAKRDSAEVAFRDPAGQDRTARPWTRSILRKYHLGERVDVLVSPHAPGEAKFNESLQIWATTHMLLWFSVIAGGFGLLMHAGVLRLRPLRQKRLRIGL